MGLDKLFQLFFGAIGLFDQQRLDEEANKFNRENWQAGLDEIRNLQQRVTPAINELVSTTSAGYRRREQDIMKGLEGYGQQELTDIDEAFRGQGERIGANLSARGLSGTTIGGAMRTGLQREQQDARGSALQRHQDIIAGYGSRLSGDRLQAQERLGLLGPTFDQSMTSQYLNWLGQREDVPGQSIALAAQQMLGSIFAPEPQQPEQPEWWETFLGQGIQGNYETAAGTTIGLALSDRNTKENFREIDRKEILRKVRSLGITKWNYKGDDENLQHIGPMAQDFFAEFEVGHTDTGISFVDASGVALAAIQALYDRIIELEEKLERVQQEVA